MKIQFKKDNNISYKRKRIVRVICKYKVGDSFGTGFFIERNDRLLTCFHVVFGKSLREIRKDNDLINIRSTNEHDKLQKFYDNTISTLRIELSDGQKVDAELLDFDEKFDIVLLKINEDKNISFFKLDTNYDLDYDDNVFFCGYQYAADYESKDFPFTVNNGVVSTFPKIIIGGEKYQHIQLNSINLGGNSGAPIFREGSNEAIAIINGNMRWGRDDILYRKDKVGQDIVGSLRIPLGIAYATPLKTLKSQTSILSQI